MKAFVIQAANKKEEYFIENLLKRLGISASQISLDELEDFALLKLMKEADRTKKVDRSVVFKELEAG
jgi:hypothetical protein